jgi:hypothetical protein
MDKSKKTQKINKMMHRCFYDTKNGEVEQKE